MAFEQKKHTAILPAGFIKFFTIIEHHQMPEINQSIWITISVAIFYMMLTMILGEIFELYAYQLFRRSSRSQFSFYFLVFLFTLVFFNVLGIRLRKAYVNWMNRINRREESQNRHQ